MTGASALPTSLAYITHSAREATVTWMYRHHEELSPTFGAEMAKWSKAVHRPRDLIAAMDEAVACFFCT